MAKSNQDPGHVDSLAFGMDLESLNAMDRRRLEDILMDQIEEGVGIDDQDISSHRQSGTGSYKTSLTFQIKNGFQGCFRINDAGSAESLEAASAP